MFIWEIKGTKPAMETQRERRKAVTACYQGLAPASPSAGRLCSPVSSAEGCKAHCGQWAESITDQDDTLQKQEPAVDRDAMSR